MFRRLRDSNLILEKKLKESKIIESKSHNRSNTDYKYYFLIFLELRVIIVFFTFCHFCRKCLNSNTDTIYHVDA